MPARSVLLSVNSNEVPLINILDRPGRIKISEFPDTILNLRQKPSSFFDMITRQNEFIRVHLWLLSLRVISEIRG